MGGSELFNLTRYNLFLVFFISVGGLTYGSGFSVFISSIGQPGFYTYFNLAKGTAHTNSILGAVNALFSFGAAVGALTQGWLSDYLGRKKAMFIATVLSILGGALCAGSVHIAMLIVVRVLNGFGLGMIVTMSPMYIAEISPRQSRGLLVGVFAVFIGFGYTFSAWTSVGTYYATNPAVQWRLPLAIATIFPLFMASGLYWVPESPRWLCQNDRADEAWTILQRMHHDPKRNSDVTAHAEYVQIRAQVEEEKQFDTGYIAMFKKKSWRKRTLIGMFIMFANQSTGVLGIGAYAVLIYQSLGMTGSMPIVMNAVYTTVGVFIAEVTSGLIMDRAGRRRLLLLGFPITGLVLLGEALLQRSYEGTSDKAGNAACVLFLFLFITAFDLLIQCPGIVYVTEIFPTAIRSRGIGLSWFSYFVGAITYTTPSGVAFANIGYKMYFVWLGCNVVSTILVYFFVPETKGLSLEEMGELFGDEVVVHLDEQEQFEEKGNAVETAEDIVTA